MRPKAETIKTFIRRLREAKDLLDRGWNWDAYNIGVFRSVTQAVVLQFRAPDAFIAFFSTRSDRPDLEIELAADLRLCDVTESLSADLERYSAVKFQGDLFSNDKEISFKVLIEDATEAFFRKGLSTFIPKKETGFLFCPGANNIAIYIGIGLAEEMDVDQSVATELDSAHKERSRTHPERAFFIHSGYQRTVYAARFVSVGKDPEPKKTFPQQMLEILSPKNEDLWLIDPPFWKTNYGKTDLVIFSSGVLVADTPHKEIALETLNGFLATANWFHTLCPPVNIWEMGTVFIDEHGIVKSYGGPSMKREKLLSSKDRISEEEIQKYITVFAKCQLDQELMAQLRLRHASGVHFLSGEYLQCFLMAWAVIEREVERIWVQLLIDRGINQKRLDKLWKHDEFTLNQLAEISELLGGLEYDLYETIQKLRRVRNDVVHRGSAPTLEQCSNCIKVANTFIHKRVSVAEKLSTGG